MSDAFRDQLIIAVIGGVVGAVVTVLLERWLDRGARNDRIIAHTYQDVRILVVQEFGSPPQPSQRRERERPPASSGGDDAEITMLAAFGVGMTIVGAIFLELRTEIIGAIVIATGVLFGVLAASVGYFVSTGALVGWEWFVYLTASFLVLAGGVADVLALESPRFDDFELLLARFESDGFGAVIEDYGSDGFFFVVYQGLGVACWAVAVIAVLLGLLFLVGRTNFARGARPSWLWRFLARHSLGRGSPVTLLVGAAVLAILSYLFVSGLLYELFNNNMGALQETGSAARLGGDRQPD